MKVKDLPISERPRERLQKVGVENLTNEELIAIILKSGNRKKSVKELSMEILKEANGIQNLKNITKEKLQTINGIGLAQSFTILSVIELGKRIFINQNTDTKIILNSSNKIYEYMK